MSTKISDEHDVILPGASPVFRVLWTFSKLPDVPWISELCVDSFAGHDIFDIFNVSDALQGRRWFEKVFFSLSLIVDNP